MTATTAPALPAHLDARLNGSGWPQCADGGTRATRSTDVERLGTCGATPPVGIETIAALPVEVIGAMREAAG